jgi:hypothetical protein
MKNLKRQDRNGTRTTSDLERKYKFEKINYTEEEIEELKKKIIVDSSLSTTSTNPVENRVITQALNNKVSKEPNKVLSSNDFTDELKEKLESIPDNVSDNVEYSYYIITEENIKTIPITYSEYSEKNTVDVYINGLKKIKGLHYSIDENNIVLTDEIGIEGTEIEIVIK